MALLKFKNKKGQLLSGDLHLPPLGEPLAYALFAHCFTCSMSIKAAFVISDALAKKGIAVLRFDFTGLGGSEGDFADSHFTSNVDDLVSTSQYLSEHYASPKILIGHSLGGAAVLAAAASIGSSKAVVTIGAPADAKHVLHLFEEHVEEIKRIGEREVSIGGRTFTMKDNFIEDVNQQKITEKLGDLKRALLIMHSPTDQLVGIEHAASIFQNAKHPKSFISLDNANHLLTKSGDAKYAAGVLASWVTRYIN